MCLKGGASKRCFRTAPDRSAVRASRSAPSGDAAAADMMLTHILARYGAATGGGHDLALRWLYRLFVRARVHRRLARRLRGCPCAHPRAAGAGVLSRVA